MNVEALKRMALEERDVEALAELYKLSRRTNEYRLEHRIVTEIAFLSKEEAGKIRPLFPENPDSYVLKALEFGLSDFSPGSFVRYRGNIFYICYNASKIINGRLRISVRCSPSRHSMNAVLPEHLEEVSIEEATEIRNFVEYVYNRRQKLWGSMRAVKGTVNPWLWMDLAWGNLGVGR